MLKKFFISMLGTMAGLWLSLILFGVIFFLGISALVIKSVSAKDVGKEKVLYLDLSGTISERETSFSFQDVMSMVNDEGDNLSAILSALRIAATDKEVKGLYINCAGADAGLATSGEIAKAISEFKDSKKWVYAYGDNISQIDYYIASAADSIFLNPVGSLELSGLKSTTIFFKDVLEKIGVTVNVVRVGSYKSAVEPFLRMDMSPESREQMSIYLNQIWGDMTGTIAENRGIETKTINMLVDSIASLWDAERYLNVKAVSSLKYRSEVEDNIRSILKIDKDKDLPLVTPSEYLAIKGNDFVSSSSDHIAVLYAEGEIYIDGESGITSEKMVPEILKLANDDNVKGLVLRVNSPGGSAFASEQIWKALEDFKATGKPYYVSMGDYAASGGYYISCGADVIYCDPATLTGSIGIFGVIPNAQNLLEKKIGLGFGTVKTNSESFTPSYYENPTPRQLNALQKYVEHGYDMFTSRVAQGRDISVDSVKVIGGGRVWDGISALKIGLVDRLGGIRMAVKDMAEKTGLSVTDVVEYPVNELSVVQNLIKQSRRNIEVDIEGLSLEQAKEYMEYVYGILEMDPLQARMENIVIK